tara:strand:- start:1712 stop:2863 length:1152 start_codon:yes stop_codon:yes gene_type:complete
LNNYFKYNKTNSNIYWFHSSSLGEFYQLLPVLEGVKQIEPDSLALVSFFSPSGYQNASSDLIDLKVYLPFDFFWSVKRSLDLVKPKKLIFASYDIWPNLIWYAKSKDIHINIFALRFNNNSCKLKPVFRNFFRSVYKSFSTIYTISENDSLTIRFLIRKMNSQKLKALGNPRYDMVKHSAENIFKVQTESILLRPKRLILASVHKEDDKIILPVIFELLNLFPELNIVYVPHEPVKKLVALYKNRFEEKGFNPVVFEDASNLTIPNERVVILGIIGVLSRMYWQAQIAYVGGGFSTGIHNVMEPAVANLPVIFGPKYHDFQEAEELLKNRGGFSVKSESEFRKIFKLLFTNEENLLKSSLAATDVIHRNLGSASRIVRGIIHD